MGRPCVGTPTLWGAMGLLLWGWGGGGRDPPPHNPYNPSSLPPGCEFGQADMQKLVPKEEKTAPSPPQGGGKRAGKQ